MGERLWYLTDASIRAAIVVEEPQLQIEDGLSDLEVAKSTEFLSVY